MPKYSFKEIDVLLTWPRDGIRLFESMIPLGIGIMATILRDNGFSVKIIDFNNYTRDFISEIKELKPKVALVGGTTNTRFSCFRTIKTIKKHIPQTVTVFGGHHATYTAEDSLLHIPQIDFVSIGEGELIALDLCKSIINNSSKGLYDIPGLAYRKEGEVVQNPPKRIDNLEILPIADRSLFECRYPINLDFFDLPADYIMTSRGCLSACTFCSAVTMYPGGVRLVPIDIIEQEIISICNNPEIKALKIFDSTFTANRDHVLAFCSMIKKYNLKWECEIRVDTVDHELLALMKNAGCVYVNFGIESANEKITQTINKNITLQQVDNVIEWCHELNIKTKAFFTFGHLDETYDDCLRTLKLMKTYKGKIDFFATTVGMRIYPGTPLEKTIRDKNLFPKNFSWAKYHPGIRNWLLLEPTNIFILSQKQLPLWRLTKILLKLFRQNTILSPHYIKKMIVENIKTGFSILRTTGRELVYSIRRMLSI